MTNVTENQAAEKLISLYKRECDNSQYYKIQTAFDDYVSKWCVNSELNEHELTQQQLNEIAFNAVVYDGFLASFNK